MPLYEYKCASCGDVFEVIQKFSDEPLHEHPGCGGAVEKLISASAMQFKGSGWYVNDYGPSNSRRDKSKGESSDGKSSESKSSEGKSSEGKSAEGKSSDSGKNGDSKAVSSPASGASSTSKTDK
jgi:putative FmdB family regulatory protein